MEDSGGDNEGEFASRSSGFKNVLCTDPSDVYLAVVRRNKWNRERK